MDYLIFIGTAVFCAAVGAILYRYFRAHIRPRIIVIGVAGAWVLLAVAFLALYSPRRALFTAVREGNLEQVRQVLEEHPSWLETKDLGGDTPLAEAVIHGRKEVVQFLLGKGALPDHPPDRWVETTRVIAPLLYAAYYGRVDIGRVLLEHGANVNAEGFSHRDSALQVASGRGHLAFAEMLIQHGADVNERNDVGETALIDASGQGHLAVVRLLLAHGADVSPKDQSGQSALCEAAEHGHADVVRVLLEAGADVDDAPHPDSLKWDGHDEVYRILKEAGAWD